MAPESLSNEPRVNIDAVLDRLGSMLAHEVLEAEVARQRADHLSRVLLERDDELVRLAALVEQLTARVTEMEAQPAPGWSATVHGDGTLVPADDGPTFGEPAEGEAF